MDDRSLVPIFTRRVRPRFTPCEVLILNTLCNADGEWVPRENLIRVLEQWMGTYRPSKTTIYAQITTLRAKLGQPKRVHTMIESKRKDGVTSYRWKGGESV